MRHINEIVVHCTSTRPAWMKDRPTSQKVAEVKRWHTQHNGWSDIGYHWLIDRDGTVSTGRPVERAGAHVIGHNRNSIGIALFGGHGGTENDIFHENFTPAQNRALRDLIKSLRIQFPSITIVSGHNQYAAKACPCFDVQDWYQSAQPNFPEQKSLFALLMQALKSMFGGSK